MFSSEDVGKRFDEPQRQGASVRVRTNPLRGTTRSSTNVRTGPPCLNSRRDPAACLLFESVAAQKRRDFLGKQLLLDAKQFSNTLSINQLDLTVNYVSVNLY